MGYYTLEKWIMFGIIIPISLIIFYIFIHAVFGVDSVKLEIVKVYDEEYVNLLNERNLLLEELSSNKIYEENKDLKRKLSSCNNQWFFFAYFGILILISLGFFEYHTINRYQKNKIEELKEEVQKLKTKK